MTAPRRVPTEVERTAGHVRLDPTAGVIARHAVDAHPWQEHNAYGNTCHYTGCRMTEDEHKGEEPA